MTLLLPIRTVSEPNVRQHWAARARRVSEQRMVARVAVRAAKVRDLVRAVQLTRLAPRHLDDDNLQAALKAVRDGVADALGINDGDAAVRWRYAQERARIYGVQVTVETI